MSSLNDFFIHSMVHPDVAAAYLEGKPVPPALLINEVPETSAAPVVAEIVSSVNDGEWIIFKVSNTNVPTTPVVTRLHDPSEPSGPSDPSQPSISEFIVFGRILSSYNGWTMIYMEDSSPYTSPSIDTIRTKKDSGDSGDLNDLEDLLPPINKLIFARSGGLKSTSKDISVYRYVYDGNELPDSEEKSKSANGLSNSMSRFWDIFNPEYLEKIGDASILKAPTFNILQARITDEGIVVTYDAYDPDLILLPYQEQLYPYMIISMPDPENPGNIIKGISHISLDTREEYADFGEYIQDYIETHVHKGIAYIYPDDIFWNYQDDSDDAVHEYMIPDGTNMYLKLTSDFGGESNEIKFTIEFPRMSLHVGSQYGIASLGIFVNPQKFGIEDPEDITPELIDLDIQYREGGSEEWLDWVNTENTGTWDYFPDETFTWGYYSDMDFSSVAANIESGKIYELRCVLTINDQTEEIKSDFMISPIIVEHQQ